MGTSIMTTSLSFLSIKTMPDVLASISRSHWTVKSYSILKFSLSSTPSGFCSCQLLALSNPHLPQSCQRIYRAPLSCFPSYSVCASLPHSLTSWATVSPLLPHILHNVGFCCVINMKSHIICSQSLFLGATYHGLSTTFDFSFCNPLPSSIPVNTFLSSHILPMHSFLLPFILRLLYFIHFGSTASEMLTTLLSPTFLSNASSLFLTYQLKLFSSLLTQLSQLIRPLPPFFLGTYILATSLLGSSFLFIVMISSTSFIVCPFINLRVVVRENRAKC